MTPFKFKQEGNARANYSIRSPLGRIVGWLTFVDGEWHLRPQPGIDFVWSVNDLNEVIQFINNMKTNVTNGN